MKFVVYEIWTKASMVEADDTTDALKKSQPPPRDGLVMCNWYAVPLMEPMKLEPPSKTPYLSKVQKEDPPKHDS